MRRLVVAQIFNLLYRRFAIGRPSKNPYALELGDDPQNAILRYGRMQICAASRRRFREIGPFN